MNHSSFLCCSDGAILHELYLRIKGRHYNTGFVTGGMTWEEFHDQIGGVVPFNMFFHHYRYRRGYESFVQDLPLAQLDPFQLFETYMSSNMYFEDRGTWRRIKHKLGPLLICRDKDGSLRYQYFNEDECRVSGNYPQVGMDFDTAKDFVNRNHRHNVAPQSHKFSIGLMFGEQLIAVCIASIPKSRHRNDGRTLEINRTTVPPGYHNACSKIIGHVVRCGREMGYTRFITYTGLNENGASLKASGFRVIGVTAASPNGWNSASRPRVKPERYPEGQKNVWLKEMQ